MFRLKRCHFLRNFHKKGIFFKFLVVPPPFFIFIFLSYSHSIFRYLSGNPLECDCGLKWLIDLMKNDAAASQTSVVKDQDALHCSGPAEHHGKLLRDLDLQECRSVTGYRYDRYKPPRFNPTRKYGKGRGCIRG